MIGIQKLGKICPASKECPVYKGDLAVEGVTHIIVKNVFCNRGYRGWKNCVRYQEISEKGEVPQTANPYKIS